MKPKHDPQPDREMEGIPTDYDQMGLSKHGLDWGDISLVRSRLAMTPSERLHTFQDFMNGVLQLRENGRRSQK